MASALVGTAKRPPMWATNDLRVTAGTSIDLAIRPNPLTQKEDLLLLSLWRRYCQVLKGCALGTWLMGDQQLRTSSGALQDLSFLANYRLPFLVADALPLNLCYSLQHLKSKTWTWQF